MRKQMLTVYVPLVLVTLVLSSAYLQEYSRSQFTSKKIRVSNVTDAKFMIHRLRAQHPNATLSLIINGKKTILHQNAAALWGEQSNCSGSLMDRVFEHVGRSTLRLSLLVAHAVEIVGVRIEDALMRIADRISDTLWLVHPNRRCVTVC